MTHYSTSSVTNNVPIRRNPLVGHAVGEEGNELGRRERRERERGRGDTVRRRRGVPPRVKKTCGRGNGTRGRERADEGRRD